MYNYILEIPASTNYTIYDIQKILDSPEFQGIIELYNSFLNRDENINTATGGYASKAKLDLTVGTLYDNSKQWQAFYSDEITHCADVARVYNDLWQEAQNYAYENLKGEELEYFYTETD